MCSPLGCPVVQPAGPPFCAARQPTENSYFSFGNMALQPAWPAGPPFSVIPSVKFVNSIMGSVVACALFLLLAYNIDSQV